MAALAKKEILDELMKLGIDTSAERNAYLQDYIEYFALRHQKTETQCKLSLKVIIGKIINTRKKGRNSDYSSR